MPSTYSPNLRIELIASGEQASQWGNTTNTNLGTLIEQAISGAVEIDVTAGDVTLTALNGVSDESRNMILLVSGTPGASRQIITPQVSKLYIVLNNSDATVSIVTTADAGSVDIVAGGSKVVFTDATDFYAANLDLGTPTSGNLSNCVGLPPSGMTSAGAAGNVLTSNGTTWTSVAPSWGLVGVTESTYPYQTALGYQAGNYGTSTGLFTVAIGYQALTANTTGIDNIAIGYIALNSNTNGGQNVAIGRYAGYSITSGSGNTAVGNRSDTALTTGSYNTVLGDSANSGTTGSYNTAIGSGARACGTGSYNTAVGSQSGNSTNTGSNNTFFGYGANGASTSASNAITLGNSSITTLRCQVTTITALSDARDKTDIAELDAGLDFINALAPVSFTWNMRDGGKVDEPDTGFIAQELVKAQEDTGHYIPGLVYDENPERLEAGYGKLIPVLVKAIQELSAEVSALKSQLNGANND